MRHKINHVEDAFRKAQTECWRRRKANDDICNFFDKAIHLSEFDPNKLDEYEKTEKPWGCEYIIYKDARINYDWKVKLLVVNPNQRLSLQYHECKYELMKLWSGNGFIILNEKKQIMLSNHIYEMRPYDTHRLCAGDDKLQVLELSKGKDTDIVRLEDDYQR